LHIYIYFKAGGFVITSFFDAYHLETFPFTSLFSEHFHHILTGNENCV